MTKLATTVREAFEVTPSGGTIVVAPAHEETFSNRITVPDGVTMYSTGLDRLFKSMLETHWDELAPTTVVVPASQAEHWRRLMFESISEIAPHATPLQLATTTSMALAGLGFLIARRNALADQQDSESWARWVVQWLVALVRGLLGEEAI